MKLNKFAYLYSKPLGNHTLEIMEEISGNLLKNLEKSWKYYVILSVRKSGNPDCSNENPSSANKLWVFNLETNIQYCGRDATNRNRPHCSSNRRFYCNSLFSLSLYTCNIYRQQGKVMFSEASVIPSTGRGVGGG